MSAYAANATKPKMNRSAIVDRNMKNLRTELTVTIPQNDKWTGGLKAIAGTNRYYDVQSRSVLAMVSESPLMQNFCECFDQFKLMDTHLCIDVTQVPLLRAGIKQMWCHRLAFEWTDDQSLKEWHEVTEPVGTWLTQEIIDELETTFPPNNMVSGLNAQNEPTQLFDIEVPFTIGASAGRTVPNGFYQTDVQNPYADPTWETMMSFGNAIYQSKMPGAPVHLSLDIAGSSNSERMMCFPSQIINRLYHLKPSNQSGRFCPNIYVGIMFEDMSPEQQMAAVSHMVRNSSMPYHIMGNNQDFRFANVYQYRIFVDNGIKKYVRVKCSYSFTLDGETEASGAEIYQFLAFAGVSKVGYAFSVQGYHQVRFKQLRTLCKEIGYEYQLLGVRLDSPNMATSCLDYLDDTRNLMANFADGTLMWKNYVGNLNTAPVVDASLQPLFLLTYVQTGENLQVTFYCKQDANGNFIQSDIAALVGTISADDKAKVMGYTIIGIKSATAFAGSFSVSQSIVCLTRDRQPSQSDVLLAAVNKLSAIQGAQGYYKAITNLSNSQITLLKTPVVQ